MASQTVTLYYNATQTQAFNLVSSGSNGAAFIASGRPLSQPIVLEISRKINSNSVGNDKITLRIARTDANATTGKLATFQAKLELSVPKDVSVITPTIQQDITTMVMSALRDATAAAATRANVTALLEGRDI